MLGTSIAQRVAGRWIQATPQISDFDGISIYVYPNDHPPPHIHVYHGSDEAEVAILDGKVIQGKLKTLIVRKVREWLKLRRNEVFKSHAEAQTGKRPSKVPPP